MVRVRDEILAILSALVSLTSLLSNRLTPYNSAWAKFRYRIIKWTRGPARYTRLAARNQPF